MDTFAGLATAWLLARPRVCAALDVATFGQLNRVVVAWAKRREMAMQLRWCGNASPRWYESNAARAKRVEFVARWGRDAT